MANGFPKIVVSSGFCLSQQCLEFGECLFDGIEIGRVAGQEKDPCPTRSDRVGGAWTFVDVEIVPDHHIARLEGWSELGDHIGIEGFAVYSAVNHPGCYKLVAFKGGDECLGVPFAKRRIGNQPLAPVAAPPQRRHVSLDTGLVNEQQPFGSSPDGWQAMFVPVFTLGLDVGAFAFRRQQRFFYS